MVLALVNGAVVLSGPCGAAPWYVEVGRGADPMAIVAAITALNVADPVVVHSTSWRQARALPPGWPTVLATYVPEPFRHL